MDLNLKRQIMDHIEGHNICCFCDLVDTVADSDEMLAEVVDNTYFWVHYIESRFSPKQLESLEPF